jgi:hypothetical protein
MATGKKSSIIRLYAWSTVVSVALLVFVGFEAGMAALVLTIILAGLEITFSVDNAVINTRILQRMTPAWQRAFLTVGILIAVIGVRVVLPLVIVAVAADLSVARVVDLALHHPEEYGNHLNEAHPIIAAFGGIFLFMIFLDFFLERRKTKWLVPLERILERAGKLESVSVITAVVLLLLASRLVEGHERQTVLISGLVGLLIYLLINALDTLLSRSGMNKTLQTQAKATFKAGLVGFLYLNIVDASFSLDGVIGAFAITDKILLIAIGLGVGALYVRVITLHMLQHGVLDRYRYTEHGAHYAIGILAAIMLLSLKFQIPDAVAGLSGVAVIAASVWQSRLENKREAS